MLPKLIVLAACLFSMAAAQDPSLFGEEGGELQPAYFAQAELLSNGIGLTPYGGGFGCTVLWPTGSLRLLHLGAQYNRVRLGLALLDVVATPVICALPVTAGYTIYERPVGYAGCLYAKVPEVYVEATAGFINWIPDEPTVSAEIPFSGTLELVCSVDGYGLGASVAAGCFFYYYYASNHPWALETGLYAVARLHLLRLRWGRGADVPE